jgi:hypothetical protein
MAKTKAPAKAETDKLGQFEIGLDVITEMSDLVRRIMGECIVMRAEYLYATKSVQYHALHDEFEDREPGTPPPVYEPSYDEDSDKVTWTKV